VELGPGLTARASLAPELDSDSGSRDCGYSVLIWNQVTVVLLTGPNCENEPGSSGTIIPNGSGYAFLHRFAPCMVGLRSGRDVSRRIAEAKWSGCGGKWLMLLR
jgi:hypothetical protein